jgi:hypothetical protein
MEISEIAVQCAKLMRRWYRRRTGCTVIVILGESEPIKTAFLATSFPIQP